MDEPSQHQPDAGLVEPELVAREPAPPWGFWLTLVWSVAALVAAFIAQIVVVVIVLVLRMVGRPRADFEELAERLGSDGLVLSLATIASCTVVVPILALASRIRGHRVRDYLGLKPLRRGEVIRALATLGVYVVVVDGITWLLGRDVVPFMIEAYQTAGFLPLLIAALVVAAPIAEELIFRGFAFRGLSRSWPGVWGAILITSVCWAALHVQYDLYQMATIVLAGVLLGYWRWKTGSTSLTILMHGAMNIVATLEAAIAIEVLGAGGP